jgi:hypothetical protein
MDIIYWILILLFFFVYFMNEVQQHVKDGKPIVQKKVEHFVPIIDYSLPVHYQPTVQPNMMSVPDQQRYEQVRGGIFGQTPPYLTVQPQHLDFQTQSFPYNQNEPYMPVSLVQSAGQLPPNYRLVRGNGVPRQIERLY